MEHQFSQATQRHHATQDDELERESGVLIGYVVSQSLTKLSNALSAKQSSGMVYDNSACIYDKVIYE